MEKRNWAINENAFIELIKEKHPKLKVDTYTEEVIRNICRCVYTLTFDEKDYHGVDAPERCVENLCNVFALDTNDMWNGGFKYLPIYASFAGERDWPVDSRFRN